MTIDEIEQMVLVDYRLQGRSSAARLRPAYAHLRQRFGRVEEVTYASLLSYVDARLSAGAAPATVRYELACLRRGLRLLERGGNYASPAFPTLRVDNVRRGFFEPSELAAVMRHLLPDLRPYVSFLALTGWRRGEAAALTWQRNVDWPAGVVRLDRAQSKNREPRIFPFAASAALRTLLADQRAATHRLEATTRSVVPHVFWRYPEGRPVGDVRKNWRSACKHAGCPGKLIHDLRRTAVRNLEGAGVPRSVAMKLTGHKTESVYTRYAITSGRDLEAAVAQLEAYREGKRETKE